MFKTEISDFPTLFKTAYRFLRPRLNTSNQKSLSSFVVVQASGISANKKGYKFGFLYHFYKFKCMHFPFKCVDTLFKTKSDEIDTPFKTENPANHTLSGRTCPLRPYMGVTLREYNAQELSFRNGNSTTAIHDVRTDVARSSTLTSAFIQFFP